MPGVRITGDVEVRAMLHGLTDELPKIVYFTHQNCADIVKTSLEQEIRNAIDRPTPLIQGGMRKVSSAADGLVAVGWKDVFGKNEPVVEHRGMLYQDAVSRTLIPHIDGVARVAKPSERQFRAAGIIGQSEFLVPSRTAPLDQYGNISGATMSKIIADLQGYTRAGSSSNTGMPKRQYIFGKVKGTRGIFKVNGGVSRAATGRWSLIFLVVKRAPTYSKRFRFYETSTETFDSVWEREFESVWDRRVAKFR